MFCGLILNFYVCFRFGMLISVWGFLFLFSGSVFLFWVSHFVLRVSVLGLFSPSFVVVVVVVVVVVLCCFLFLSATLYI